MANLTSGLAQRDSRVFQANSAKSITRSCANHTEVQSCVKNLLLGSGNGTRVHCLFRPSPAPLSWPFGMCAFCCGLLLLRENRKVLQTARIPILSTIIWPTINHPNGNACARTTKGGVLRAYLKAHFSAFEANCNEILFSHLSTNSAANC